MDLIHEIGQHLKTWFDTSDLLEFYAAVAVALAIIAFRRPLAGFLMSRMSDVFHRLSISLSDEVRALLTNAAGVLLVVLAIYVGLEVTNLPKLMDSVVRQVCASLAIVAVFATWHSLCGPFVQLLQSKSNTPAATEQQWMERVVQFAIILLGIAALLKVWHVDISGALTGVGVLGAAVAIAAQDLVRNLVAGMNNINEKRFIIGDAIEIEGVLAGSVEHIDLRSTTVRGFDQIPRYVPNADLSNAVVKNYGQLRHRRVMTTIPLLLSCSQAQVLKIRDDLQTYLQECGDFDLSPDAPQYITVQGLSDHAIDILFYARTTLPDYGNWLEVQERLTLKILQVVEDAAAALAYPTQTIHANTEPSTAPT